MLWTENVMKRLLLAGFVALCAVSAFPQAGNGDFLAYFPTEAGHTWVYLYKGQLRETLISEGSTTIQGTGERVYSYSRTYSNENRTGYVQYAIDTGFIYMRRETSQGNWLQRNQQMITIGLPGNEWDFGRKKVKTQAAAVSVDGKNYDDCILVITKIYYDDELTSVNKRYFARGAGLVFETDQNIENSYYSGSAEEVTRKLISFR